MAHNIYRAKDHERPCLVWYGAPLTDTQRWPIIPIETRWLTNRNLSECSSTWSPDCANSGEKDQVWRLDGEEWMRLHQAWGRPPFITAGDRTILASDSRLSEKDKRLACIAAKTGWTVEVAKRQSGFALPYSMHIISLISCGTETWFYS